MQKITIEESDMVFGEYDEKQVFCIEKSSQYCQTLKSHGIKSCEFVLLRGRNLLFVEAKRSCPNYFEAITKEEKKQKYEEYVNEIVEKMKHSLWLYTSILAERYEKDVMSDDLFDTKLRDINIRLVLVVKNAQKEWLEPFRDVFCNRLMKEMRIWKIQTFLVINEQMAREKQLIV